MVMPLIPGNGSGDGNALGSALLTDAQYTPEQIVEMVDTQERDLIQLHDRMEGDYKLHRLEPFVPTDPVTGQILTDYAAFTSNEPKNFANKVIAWLIGAQLMLRVEHTNDRTHNPELDNLKEHFAVGSLRAADERLTQLVQPRIRGLLAFYVTVRGGVMGGRCLLRKDSRGQTFADITPWDPMHTYWAVDEEGLKWACHKIKKTAQQIWDEYGVRLAGTPTPVDTSRDAETQGVDVYDFYDRYANMVVAGHEILKMRTPHGSPRVPVYMVMVGSHGQIQGKSVQGTIADMGESVYEAVRNTYDAFNGVMSVVLELVARSRDQSLAVTSADGTKTLPVNPLRRFSQVSLTPDEKIEAIKLMEMAKDTSVYLGIIQGEIQRGTLPHTVYGELAFQLSGYAINTLRQGIESVLASRLEALEQIYLQVANLLYDQYQTGFFDSMRLSGVGKDRRYFSHQITPEAIGGGCDFSVKLVSQLPQDDMTRYNIAQMAQGYFARTWIKDNILGIQDSEQTEQQLLLQKAQEVLPEAALYTLMKAAEDQGNMQLAAFYYGELIRLTMAKMGMMPPGGMPGAPPGQGTPSAPPGARPEAMPEAARGRAPAPETSNLGPTQVAPGTPRPGVWAR